MHLQRSTRHASSGKRRAAALTSRLGSELRIARLTGGMTQAQVAAMVGVSQPFVSLVERGRRRADLGTACALASAIGHELSVKLFPVATPSLRDSGQLSLIESLIRRAHGTWKVRVEEPVAPGDHRCADLLLIGVDEVLHVEVERWLVDFQAQLRHATGKRAALSQHLGRPVRLVVAVPGTRRVRGIVAELAQIVGASLPRRSREVLRAIEHGTALGADGLLILPSGRPPRRRQS